MLEDKYVGLILAIVSTLAIGSSFVITKKGLNQASEQHGFEGDGFSYLLSPLWWGGIITMAIGEIANFAAYAFAPAILVTPLGALSVLIGAILGSYTLGEKLGKLGKIGCGICFIGSIIIILHAPPDQRVDSIDELLELALHPAFLLYSLVILIFSMFMIYCVAPQHGRRNPLIYISICSTVGSISIMAIKAFGIAVKLTFSGNNQFTKPSVYIFAGIIIVCILTQMNYFNKALSHFSTSIVNPIYYVSFTTATLCASFFLFGGFNTTDAINTISLLCGFLIIFLGVYLLNLSRKDASMIMVDEGEDSHPHHQLLSNLMPTDGITSFTSRQSMQRRRSEDIEGISLRLQQRRTSHHRGAVAATRPLIPNPPAMLNYTMNRDSTVTFDRLFEHEVFHEEDDDDFDDGLPRPVEATRSRAASTRPDYARSPPPLQTSSSMV